MGQAKFVLGRAGSGKTTYCYNEIVDELKVPSYERLLVLVPEQFNLQTQQDLAKKLYPGLLRVEVISFNTLAREVFREVGKADIPIIEDLERMIILKKVIEEHKHDIVFYKKNINHTGFIESVNRLITVFEQSGVDAEILDEMMSSEAASTLFQSKLGDIRQIYSYFESYIASRFMTMEKNMNLLAQSIHKSKKLANVKIWIDGFYGFTFTQLQIIKELMKKVQEVTITLPMDKPYGISDKVRVSHPFYESIHMYQKLMGICEAEKVPYRSQFVTHHEADQIAEAPEISHLEANYLKPYQITYEGVSQNVHVRTYSSRYDEVIKVAREIVTLVREEGYRYHDIAIIVGELADYKAQLQSVFKEYEIPYFLDMKRNIHTNSLVATIEAVLEVLTASYSYKSMMGLLRTYMLPISRKAIDQLENYILAHGIKGKKKWLQEWHYAREDWEKALEPTINETRVQIIEPIEALRAAIKEKSQPSVAELTKALYGFLEQIGAYETLQEIIKRNKDEVNRLLELENTQIWGKVIEVFERLVEILGDEKVSLTTYKKLLETSFSYLKMGIIPPSKDQVLIGELERTRLPHPKAVFILGTNEGLIPKNDELTPIFSDMDKMTLFNICSKEEGPKGRFSDLIVNQPLYAANFMIYTTLTRAQRKLYISAALADENGKPMRPSLVFYKLKKMFKEESGLTEAETFLEAVQRPQPTFGYIGGMLREYMEGRSQGEAWKDVVSWYRTSPRWQEDLLRLSDSLFYSNQQHYLAPETTKLLYNEHTLKTSISRLESFRNCACCYFIKYGIKAEERQIFAWNRAEVGTLFHATLEQYPKELKVMGTNWVDASYSELKQAVKNATQYAIEKMNPSERDTGGFRYKAAKVEKMATRAIKALTAHLKNGEFVPSAYEINFGEGRGFPPIEVAIDETRKVLITGQIDRVDVYVKENGENYIKILDYKTGNKNFSLLEVYYGLQLQLLLYLDAYLKLNQRYQPGGVFYFHINNPYVTYKVGMDEEDLEANQLKQFKLSGLVLEQKEIIEALDKSGTGTTIPVSINKDGSIKKGSSVATKEQFEQLEAHITEAVSELGRQILEGKVSAKPYKLGEKNPCQYCTYHTICQFNENEPDNCYDQLCDLSKEEIWKRLAHGEGAE